MAIENKGELGHIEVNADVFKDLAQIVSKKHNEVVPKSDDDFASCSISRDGDIKITVYLKIKQGKDVLNICQQIQKEIHEVIEQMTGIDVKNINIDIQGFINEVS